MAEIGLITRSLAARELVADAVSPKSNRVDRVRMSATYARSVKWGSGKEGRQERKDRVSGGGRRTLQNSEKDLFVCGRRSVQLLRREKSSVRP